MTEEALLVEEFKEVDEATSLTYHQTVPTDRKIDPLCQILCLYFHPL